MDLEQPTLHAATSAALDERTSATGLRAIATFEALKGIGVLLLMCVLLLVHRHAEYLVENLLFHLHIDPDQRAAQAVLHAADRLTDARMWIIVLAAMTYASVRFVEAWGLWNRRVWAEWFALLSGALYLPWEALSLVEHTNWEHVTILCLNLVIVLYMLYVRVRSCRAPAQCDERPSLQVR